MMLQAELSARTRNGKAGKLPGLTGHGDGSRCCYRILKEAHRGNFLKSGQRQDTVEISTADQRKIEEHTSPDLPDHRVISNKVIVGVMLLAGKVVEKNCLKDRTRQNHYPMTGR